MRARELFAVCADRAKKFPIRMEREMKKVGILVGREKTFPEALIKKINERGNGEVIAEYLKLGGIKHDAPPAYDLVIDRISHEVPFYRATLKRMALEGTTIVNNPFWWSADDKFFNYSLAAKLGVAVPRTVLLPQKDYINGIVSESLRNLEFPLDWQAIIDYVGLPAFLKPFDGGGWKNVSKVNSLEELWTEYDQTGTLCMTLQAAVDFEQFVRCYCVGQDQVMIMAYDPRKPYLSGEQYIHHPDYLAPQLADRVTKDVRTLCTALGYDLNTVEFAIKDGIPYAIDFMNPAPDAELASVGEFYHNWITNAVTDLVFKRLGEQRERPRYRWDAFLSPEPVMTEAVASRTEQQARTMVPKAEAKVATATGEAADSSEAGKSKTAPRSGVKKDGRNSNRSKPT
jgi:glutathione synthase/RimK-type ligase-like ATP-grasp enzyme